MKVARPVRKGADGKVLRTRGVTRRRPTLLYVAGRLVQNSWEGDDGQRRYRTEIHAQDVVFLDSSRNGNGGNGNGNHANANAQTDDDLPF